MALQGVCEMKRKTEIDQQQVQWNVNVRMRKRGQAVRVQDLAVLCRPVYTDSVLGIPMGGNIFISYHDLGFRFIFCDPSDAEAEQKFSQEKEDFDEIKCFGFNLAADLPLTDLEKSNYLALDNYQKLGRIDSDLFLQHICDSSLSFHTDFTSSQRQQRNITKISYMNVDSNAAKSWPSITSPNHLYPELLINTVCNCGFKSTSKMSGNLDEACSSSNAHSDSLNEANTSFHHANARSESVIIFDKKSINHLALDINPIQERHLHHVLPQQATISNNCFNQVPVFPGILSQHMLMDTFPDQQQTSLDGLTFSKSQVSNNPKPVCQSATDHESVESAAGNQSVVATEQNASDVQAIESFKVQNIQNSTQSVTDSNSIPDLSIPSQNLLSSPGDILQTSDYEVKNKAKISCHLNGQSISDILNNTVSSRLASILQMGSISPPLVTKNMKANERLNACHDHDDNHKIACRRNNACTSNIQTDRAYSTVTTCSTLCNTVFTPGNMSPSSSPDFNLQVSSAVSTLPLSAFNWSLAKSKMLSSPTPLSTSDSYSPVSKNRSQDVVQTDNTNVSLLLESKVTQSADASEVHGVSSKMTNKKSDPFLSQASFSELNTLGGTDLFDDLASVICPVMSTHLLSVTSQKMCTAGCQDKPSYLRDQYPPSNFHTFMDSSESTTDAAFVSEGFNELESFLNTIPLSLCMTPSLNNATNTLSIPFSEYPESDISKSPFSESVSNDSSDSETSSRPSLLRSLLNKEGSAIQGPQTYREWMLQQIPKESCDINKTKVPKGAADSRHTFSRHSKNAVRKSTELPRLRFSHGHMMKFGRDILQAQKQTKELPLPLSVKAAASTQSFVPPKQGFLAGKFIHQNEISDKEIMTNVKLDFSENTTEFKLPDDLLDMAVEYCAPLEVDQAEALLSDLNDSCSWEDNFYSLLETSIQEKSVSVSECQSSQQQSEQPVSSPGIVMSSESLFNTLQSKDNLTAPLVISSMTAASSLRDNRKSVEEHMDIQLSYPKSSFTQTPMPSKPLLKPELSTTDTHSVKNPTACNKHCSNRNGSMSLLRAAITSPDVDKLIEQIPLGNAKKNVCSSQVTSGQHDNDPDIIITKVLGLQMGPALPSAPSQCARDKVPSANTVRLQKVMYPSKSMFSSTNLLSAADHLRIAPSKHACSTSLPTKYLDNGQLLQNVSSHSDSGNTTETFSSTNPIVIKIRIGPNSRPKVICVDNGSENCVTKKLKTTSQNISCDHSMPTCPRAAAVSNTDLSSTHPVSVMVMRKENHRPRRSKSIAVQTDNEPGETYPEFEHNPLDIILYPSVSTSYPPVMSSQHTTPSLSTSLSSHSSMSDVKQFLMSHSGCDDSSSSTDDDYRSISSTPFLWKLLTGELSKDHYQRLDQQLLEKEREQSITSSEKTEPVSLERENHLSSVMGSV